VTSLFLNGHSDAGETQRRIKPILCLPACKGTVNVYKDVILRWSVYTMAGVLPYMYTRRSTHRPFISFEPVSLEITTKSVSTAIWMPNDRRFYLRSCRASRSKSYRLVTAAQRCEQLAQSRYTVRGCAPTGSRFKSDAAANPSRRSDRRAVVFYNCFFCFFW